jgi:hypothetical protein
LSASRCIGTILVDGIGFGAFSADATLRTNAIYLWRNLVIGVLAMFRWVLIIFGFNALVAISSSAPVPGAPLPSPDAAEISADLSWDGSSMTMRAAIILGTSAALTPLFALTLFIPTRFSLGFPATGIESSDQTFAHPWSSSRGSFWRLFWGGFLSYSPALAVTVRCTGVDGIRE